MKKKTKPFRSSADVLLDAMMSAPQSVGSYTHGTPFESVQEAREAFKAQRTQPADGPPEELQALPEPVHVAGTIVLLLDTGDVVTDGPHGWTRYQKEQHYNLPHVPHQTNKFEIHNPPSWARLALEISRAELGAQV